MALDTHYKPPLELDEVIVTVTAQQCKAEISYAQTFIIYRKDLVPIIESLNEHARCVTGAKEIDP